MEGSSNNSFGSNSNSGDANSSGPIPTPPQSKFTVGPLAQAAADAARVGSTPYQGAGAPSWPPPGNDIPPLPSQNSFFSPPSGQTPPKPFSGYLPPQKPKLKIPLGKIFSWLIFFAIVCGGIWLFVNKDELIGSAWAREMNKEQAKYNIDAEIFINEFERIEIRDATNEAKAKDVDAALEHLQETLATVEKDLDDIIYAADKGAERYELSLKDRKAQSDYLACATTRKNAMELFVKGIKYGKDAVEVMRSMADFRGEITTFDKHNQSLSVLMEKDDVAGVANAFTELQKSSMRMRNNLLKVHELIGMPSLLEEAEAYGRVSAQYGNVAAAFKKDDVPAFNKAIADLAKEVDTLGVATETMSGLDQKYIDQNVNGTIIPAAQSLKDIRPTCEKAELATKPRIDIAKIKGWFKM